MSLEASDLIAARRVPTAEPYCPRADSNGAAVGHERHAGDIAHVSLESSDLFATRRIPEPRRRVIGSGEDGAAVGTNPTLKTSKTSFTCLSNRRISLPLAASHIAVLSPEPVRMVRPSAANATLRIPLSCTSNRRISRPLATSHNRALASIRASVVRMVRPSGANATL